MSKSETTAQDDMCLAAIEGHADAWAARVDLRSMIENATSPTRLNKNVPDDVRKAFVKRMKEQIDAIARQAFIEGAVMAMNGFAVEEDDAA